ncbi:hypothetical protein LTR15_007780 [Elasticomyces elasticus]|nr:hypothetical protein LTR15_007780 [Elasticomyces elasticus]
MAKTSNQSQCGLFTLPAELRNGIYELAFSSEDSDKPIELLSAVPPSNNLVLTCHQVCDEAAGIYREAYRAFWTMSHFKLSLNDDGRPVAAHSIVRSATRDWEQMRNIVVHCLSCTFHYVPEHSLWEYRSWATKRYTSLVIPENTDSTSMLLDTRLHYRSHDTLDEALLKAKGRRGRMVNQLHTLL